MPKGEATNVPWGWEEVVNRSADLCFLPKPTGIVKKKKGKSPGGQQMGKEKQGLRCDTTVWEDGRKIEEKNGLCRGDCHLQNHRQGVK